VLNQHFPKIVLFMRSCGKT